jgi:DNA-binding FadR family transcriptional regulator
VSRDVTALAATREHVAIAKTMRARRPRDAAKIIRQHIANARSLIEDALE